MNALLNAILVTAVLLNVAACRKDPSVRPASDVPATNVVSGPKWFLYNTGNGALANDQVNALAIDENNTKWIGTANGLVRIDGTTITTFDKTNSALPSSRILSVASGEHGALWVGTDEGLSAYDGASWTSYTTGNSILKSNTVKCLTYDKKHHTLWAGTEKGIIKISGNNSWEYIEEEFVILSMATDHNGALWLGLFDAFAFRGIIEKYEQGVSSYYRLDKEGYASAFPYALVVDEHNRVLATLAGTVVKTVIRLEAGSWHELALPQNMYGVRAMAISGPEIWIGGKGLCLLNGKNPEVISIPGIASPVLSMATDREGRKWLGTFSEGLAVYDEHGAE